MLVGPCLLAGVLVGVPPAGGAEEDRLNPGLQPIAQATGESSQTIAPPEPPSAKKKLDRRTRIELMFVLVGLVGVGLAMIAFTWLAARMTRRYMKSSEKKPKRSLDPVFTDDWAAKPLTPEERARLDSDDW